MAAQGGVAGTTESVIGLLAIPVMLKPPEIKLSHMYRGVVPFIALEFVVLALVALFPAIALWLPEKVFGI